MRVFNLYVPGSRYPPSTRDSKPGTLFKGAVEAELKKLLEKIKGK